MTDLNELEEILDDEQKDMIKSMNGYNCCLMIEYMLAKVEGINDSFEEMFDEDDMEDYGFYWTEDSHPIPKHIITMIKENRFDEVKHEIERLGI